MNILKDIKEEQQRDQALYFVEDGEEGFNPDHNKFVIAETIRKTQENRKKKHKEYIEAIRERSDAVATYLKSRYAEGNTPVEKYFGKKELAHLQGQKIMTRIQNKSLLGRKTKVYLPS